MRHTVAAGIVLPGARDDIVQPIFGDLTRRPLRLQIGRGNLRTVGVGARGLQQREVIFDLIVGHQRLRDQFRLEQLVVPQLGNDLSFKCHLRCLCPFRPIPADGWALVGGDHFVDHLGNSRHVLCKSDQCGALGRRSDEAPQVNLAVADNDVAAAEIGPALLLKL